jgi:hypothetical protein
LTVASPPWPTELLVNARTPDGPITGEVEGDLVSWAFRPRGDATPKFLRPPPPADAADWRHPDVGWGLILPHDPALSDSELAGATDAAEPIQALLADRPGAPVLRYASQSRLTHLLRYDPGQAVAEVVLSGADRGTKPGALPHYLLIYGGPERIPWGLQYLLNQTAAVGRITLTGAPLERYVNALVSDWSGSGGRPEATTVWAPGRDADEMSRLMHEVIAVPVHDAFASDADLAAGSTLLDADGTTTTAQLASALAEQRPGVVVTTSHGHVANLDDIEAARATLGSPVGSDGAPVDPEALLAVWEPDGAIWYCHACCSAGADARTAFEGILPETDVDRMLHAVAAVGPAVAPLPEALLGAEKPLRAFIGHVEPTFDWTIRHTVTKQPLTASIRRALYDGLFQPWPVGRAFSACYDHVGELFAARDQAYRDFNHGEDTRDVALAAQLAALDRQSMVILGDPTVALPG